MDAGSTSAKSSTEAKVIPPVEYQGKTAGLELKIAVIETESVPFGIPESLLEDSSFFKDMVEDSVIGRAPGDGDKPAKIHIQLDAASKVTAQEMECFVQLLDIRIFQPRPNLTFQQWSSSLHLATMWHFDQVRKFIIQNIDDQIDGINPLDRIDLAIKCSVEKWLVPAYVALCTQEEPLGDPVGHRLGLVRFAALCRIRERNLKAGRDAYYTPPTGSPGMSIPPPKWALSPQWVEAMRLERWLRAEPALTFPRPTD
ncbi:hypothetical protein FRB99_002435, partial [Tulasnella sp. 403]